MNNITTITRKGQVTIPSRFRKEMNLKRGRRVQFEKNIDGEVVVRPVLDFLSMRGFFKTTKKYSKIKARKIYEKEILEGRL